MKSKPIGICFNEHPICLLCLEASGISFLFIYKHGGKIHSFGKKEARNVIDSVITKLDEAFDHDNNVDTIDSNISEIKEMQSTLSEDVAKSKSRPKLPTDNVNG